MNLLHPRGTLLGMFSNQGSMYCQYIWFMQDTPKKSETLSRTISLAHVVRLFMQGFYFRLCPYGEARTCNGTTTRTRNNIGRVQKALQQNSVVVSFSAPDKPLKCRICKKFGEIQLIHWTEFYWQHWLLYDYSWCVLRAAYCFNHSSHPNRYLACVFVSK